jgi:16S rRNA (uracil1498-N3)-methyltransferase
MNLIILEDHHFINSDEIHLVGRHHQHLTQIVKIQVGAKLRVGRLNGNFGTAEVTNIADAAVTLRLAHCDTPPPPCLPVCVLLALPRPKMLQRTLQTVATMGVEHLCLVHTQKVEKSFWQTPLLREETIKEELILGLEQGMATQLPQMHYQQHFGRFFSEQLPNFQKYTRRLVAHPGNYPFPSPSAEPTLIAIGPEGGFMESEVELLLANGFSPVQLGERILRVETAVPVLLAKLF